MNLRRPLTAAAAAAALLLYGAIVGGVAKAAGLRFR